MTRIKLCGLSRPCDVEAANALHPTYVGFVFAPKSRRYVPPEKAAQLRRLLAPGIQAVGVFVQECPETVADFVDRGIVDVVQLHGNETQAYIERLRALTTAPILQAFCIDTPQDVREAQESPADCVLLDAGGGGTGGDLRLGAAPGHPQAVFSRRRPARRQRGGGHRGPAPLRGGRQLRHRDGWPERQGKNGGICACREKT